MGYCEEGGEGGRGGVGGESVSVVIILGIFCGRLVCGGRVCMRFVGGGRLGM